MSDKSYVSLEQHQCPVCGVLHETGNVLVDRRVKDSMEKHTVTGWGLCPEHKKLHEDDFLALIELSRQPARHENSLQDTWPLRTGNLAHIKRSVAREIFTGIHVPETPIMFMAVGVIEKLQAMMPKDDPAPSV